MGMQEQVILDEVSPSGDVNALVTQDARVVYFYIKGVRDQTLATRACWVRNLQEAPPEMDIESMRAGLPPLLPAAFCKSPQARRPLDPDCLSVVWFEEGDAAALLEDDEVLAVIPCWSGTHGFSGYSLECGAQNALCWPLLPDNKLYERIDRARTYWRSWDTGVTPWEMLRARCLSVLEERLGTHHSYYAIDGGEWPPKGLLRLNTPGGVVLVTIGVALRPMPTVELYTEDPAAVRRIELGICLGGRPGETLIMETAAMLGRIAGLPWTGFSWFGHSHTLPCAIFPPRYNMSAVLFHADPPGAPEIDLGRFRGDPVNLLWLMPITEVEREYARNHGSAALCTRLHAAGVEWAFKNTKARKALQEQFAEG